MLATSEKSCTQQRKWYPKLFRILFNGLFSFDECEVFVRTDAPHACQTVLADFSSVCGCSGCCSNMVA
jgi:hypothetical protein